MTNKKRLLLEQIEECSQGGNMFSVSNNSVNWVELEFTETNLNFWGKYTQHKVNRTITPKDAEQLIEMLRDVLCHVKENPVFGKEKSSE